MPRMWLSPSPSTLLDTPFNVIRRFFHGSRGVRMRLSLKSAPVWSGQKSGGTVPLGVNMKIMRCGGAPAADWPMEGKAGRKGSAAAERPS